MKVHLLDSNLLIALVWPVHEFHVRAQSWFKANSHLGWATCPFTQAAFIRILSNPAFSADAVSPQEASALLSTNVNHQHHQFWSDNIYVMDAIEKFSGKLNGRRQITDAYLLALAIHHQAKLATLDSSLKVLASTPAEISSIVLI